MKTKYRKGTIVYNKHIVKGYWIPFGEYWSKEQVEKGKAEARAQGYSHFRTFRGSFIGSYTLAVFRDEDTVKHYARSGIPGWF